MQQSMQLRQRRPPQGGEAAHSSRNYRIQGAVDRFFVNLLRRYESFHIIQCLFSSLRSFRFNLVHLVSGPKARWWARRLLGFGGECPTRSSRGGVGGREGKGGELVVYARGA